jgi:hypothetical protein
VPPAASAAVPTGKATLQPGLILRFEPRHNGHTTCPGVELIGGVLRLLQLHAHSDVFETVLFMDGWR